MPTFRVPRNGDVDLVFTGECLVDKSSRRGQQEAWTEIRIYRTDSGRYVAESVGRSSRGTPDRRNVTVVDEPAELREALKRRRRDEGQVSAQPAYLTAFALDALTEAARKDSAVGAALEERI